MVFVMHLMRTWTVTESITSSKPIQESTTRLRTQALTLRILTLMEMEFVMAQQHQMPAFVLQVQTPSLSTRLKPSIPMVMEQVIMPILTTTEINGLMKTRQFVEPIHLMVQAYHSTVMLMAFVMPLMRRP